MMKDQLPKQPKGKEPSPPSVKHIKGQIMFACNEIVKMIF